MPWPTGWGGPTPAQAGASRRGRHGRRWSTARPTSTTACWRAYALASIPHDRRGRAGPRWNRSPDRAGRLDGRRRQPGVCRAVAAQWDQPLRRCRSTWPALPARGGGRPGPGQGAGCCCELDRRGDASAALERVYDRYSDAHGALPARASNLPALGAYRLSLLSAMRGCCILSGAGLVEDGPIFIQRFVYPRPFDDLISPRRRRTTWTRCLYFSLIRQESLFEEGARSSAAAQGLAQIIPDTGQLGGRAAGAPGLDQRIDLPPLHQRAFRRLLLGLGARLSWTATRCRRWWATTQAPATPRAGASRSGPDDTLFVEILTFSEPRVYIQLITREPLPLHTSLRQIGRRFVVACFVVRCFVVRTA